MSETRQILQLRVKPELYEALAEEVMKRKTRGETDVSLNKVAAEWMEQGKNAEMVRVRPKRTR